MNTVMVIATRELRERWRIFVVAAAFAVLPFILAAMPGARGHRSELVAIAGGTGAMAFAFAVALLIGGTTIVRDLAEKRLSFYLTKPIAPSAVWLGKSGAAVVTLLITAAVIALPSLVAQPAEWRTFWGREAWLVPKLSIVAALAFFLIAHTIATMVRSRTVLMALDLVLAVATGFAALLVVRPLLVRGAIESVFDVWKALGWAALAILAIAPVVQLARGRTDIRRSHAALSAVIWPSIAVCLLIAFGYALWLTSAGLDALDDVETMSQSRTGEWVFLTGTDRARRDVSSSFLLNTATGANESLNPLRWSRVHFSRDGRTVAWLESDELLPRFGRARLHVRRLDGTSEDLVVTGATMSDLLALSDDGSHVAIHDGRQVRVHELASGKLLAAANVGATEVKAMYYASPSTVRLIARPRQVKGASILELDVQRKSLVKRGEFGTAETVDFHELSASADGRALYVNREGKIIDAASGALRATVPLSLGATSVRASLMLSDGRVVWVHDGILSLYDRSGVHVRDVKLPVSSAIVVGELEDGKVILSGRSGKHVTGVRGRKMLKVDLARGVVVSVKEDAYGPAHWWGIDPRLPMYSANALLSGVDANDRIIQWR